MAANLPASSSKPTPLTLASVVEKARAYGEMAKAPNTRRAYAADWQHFEQWCSVHGVGAIPASPGTLAAYLAAQAGSLKVSTLGRRLSAIRAVHVYSAQPIDLASPAFRDVWAGIRRTHGARPDKKRALVTADLRKVVAALPESAIGIRDRALLLVGFASALRRSELASLIIYRVTFNDNGLLIELGKSKSDQEGQGAVIGVPFGSHAETCPVRAMRAWLEVGAIASGPVFRRVTRHGHVGTEAMTGHGIALAVKRAVFRAALADGYSKREAYALADTVGGHSLRAGFVTAADAAGAPISKVMQQARHARYETTRGYIREADAFRGNAASYLGL
jgi:integrase